MKMADNMDAVRAFIEQDKAESGGSGFFSIRKDGEYEVRVVKMGAFRTGVHWDVIQGKEGKKRPIRCPQVMRRGDCPICEEVQALYESDTPEDQERAKELAVQEKYPLLIIEAASAAEGVKLYEAPKTVYYGIFDLINKQGGAYKDLLDFARGRNVYISRTTSGGRTNYSVTPCPDRTEISVDPETIEAAMERWEPLPYETLAYALENGELPEEEEAPKAKAKPKSAPSKYDRGLPKTKTRGEFIDEAEFADEEPVEAEEEEFEDIPEPVKAAAPVNPPRRGAMSPNLRGKVAQMTKRN